MALTSHLFWLGRHGGAFGRTQRRSQLGGASGPRVAQQKGRSLPSRLLTPGVDWKSCGARELLAGETLLILGKQFSSLGCGLEMP